MPTNIHVYTLYAENIYIYLLHFTPHIYCVVFNVSNTFQNVKSSHIKYIKIFFSFNDANFSASTMLIVVSQKCVGSIFARKQNTSHLTCPDAEPHAMYQCDIGNPVSNSAICDLLVNKPTLVQTMAWRLASAKPLSEPMLAYC